MATLRIVSAAADAALSGKLAQDLSERGHQIVDALPGGYGPLLVAVLSPAHPKNEPDPVVMNAIITALDNGQHIIPVLAKPMPLPRLIDNLMYVDFSSAYPLDALHKRIEQLSEPDAPRPLKTLTPKVRRANQRAGWVVGVIALVIFVTGLYAVAVLGLRRPDAEFQMVETERVNERNTLIGPTLDAFLPRSTEDALSFSSTVEALPTRLRPFIAATATAQNR